MKDIKEYFQKDQIKIGSKRYRKCFGPNCIRYEDIDGDGQTAYRCIYINDEFVEAAPMCATEREARARLLELCEQNNVEEEQRVWKEIR